MGDDPAPMSSPDAHVPVPLQTLIGIEVAAARTAEQIKVSNHRLRNIEQQLQGLVPRRDVEKMIDASIAPIRVEIDGHADRLKKIEGTLTWAGRWIIGSIVGWALAAVGAAAILIRVFNK